MKDDRQSSSGIYVERLIRGPLPEIWRLTQTPELHQRWDLRFTEIEYLPRESESEPQRFLYQTRIGFGLAVRGTGESVGERLKSDGSSSSALKFASEDWKSLISSGSGYWRYIPAEDGVRFLTWYDYRVRFGGLGRLLDAMAFRPLMGWATAWSFDRMALWVEDGQTPEVSTVLTTIHAVARSGIALVWAWHGLVPKLILRNPDELAMLSQAHVAAKWLPWFGGAEIGFAIAFLLLWRQRWMFVLNALLMGVALAAVALNSPQYLWGAFNPVTLNFCMIALSVVGYVSSARMPTARRCLREPATERRPGDFDL